MENTENIGNPSLTPDETAFVRLIERALLEGVIREDDLRDRLNRLGAEPEIVRKLCQQLQDENIRVITGVEEPEYTPEMRSRILELLEQQGNRLSERERQVLTLRLKENKSLEEVAGQMGVTGRRILQVERKAVRLIVRPKKIREFYE